MASDNENAPIIIKRKKVVGGDGHHGGAWKVAYADFVTAMMAFFMLMWLLNATTEKQRKGIADYFSPTIPVNRVSGGGDGAFGGDSVFSEQTLPQNGTGASSLSTTASRQARGATGLENQGSESGPAEQELMKIEEALLGRGGESHIAEEAFKHIITRVTDEGLVVEIFETEEDRLFTNEGMPTVLLDGLLGLIAEVSVVVENEVAIEGHLPSNPLVLAEQRLWETSSDRAHIARQRLVELGMPEPRIQRVTGHADRELSTKNPVSAKNSRIEIIFLR